MEYRPTIGLEVHVELKTRTKMFCDCKNDPDETTPNANVCPICLAHPGALPVPNKQAIEHVLTVGTALGGTLAGYSEFDRKSYFYPDIPKGYQISQYAYPFVQGGELAGVAITRVHLEEDTAKSSHDDTKGSKNAEGESATGTSLVDFNRAGVPLMELVTEPVIHDASTAGRFARELQLLLRTLGVSDANLEKGEMRIEANISVSKTDVFGTLVEVKNLNSFRTVERAIEFEIARQSKVLDAGGKITRETRGWNESTQETFSQRAKEGSADYRYFPEPDLPKVSREKVPGWDEVSLKATLPELPDARRTRYTTLGLKDDDAAFIASSAPRSGFFDEVIAQLTTSVGGGDAAHPAIAVAANYFVSDLAGLVAKSGDEGKATPESFSKLIVLIQDGMLSSRGAKDVLARMHAEGGDAETIARESGMLQVNDSEALRAAVREVIASNSLVADEYRGGKESVLQFLLGQAMKQTKGAGNPAVLKELLQEELS
jgi:aspartyl-tRNA(Asn)/glutamyl-tRNA(Gln) amidotransferase subunit B